MKAAMMAAEARGRGACGVPAERAQIGARRGVFCLHDRTYHAQMSSTRLCTRWVRRGARSRPEKTNARFA
jgi:hypothetical protein